MGFTAGGSQGNAAHGSNIRWPRANKLRMCTSALGDHGRHLPHALTGNVHKRTGRYRAAVSSTCETIDSTDHGHDHPRCPPWVAAMHAQQVTYGRAMRVMSNVITAGHTARQCSAPAQYRRRLPRRLDMEAHATFTWTAARTISTASIMWQVGVEPRTRPTP